MKTKDLISELKGLAVDDLRQRRLKVADELMRLRFRKTSGQLEQPHRIAELRKELARVNTFLGLALKQEAQA